MQKNTDARLNLIGVTSIRNPPGGCTSPSPTPTESTRGIPMILRIWNPNLILLGYDPDLPEDLFNRIHLLLREDDFDHPIPLILLIRAT
jgi:hypothetical protein